jgi:hypothetical protein
VQHADEVVGREALLSAILHGIVVGDDALTQTIIKLRRALGDDAHRPKYIETRAVQKPSQAPVESKTALFKRGDPSRSILFSMVASRFPLQYLIAALALWLNRQQQDVIDYLKEENQLLKAKLGDRKVQFKSECLRRLILFGEASLRRALSEYLAHYHLERNHQGINNRLLIAAANDPSYGGKLVRRERLGGVLSYYHRLSA